MSLRGIGLSGALAALALAAATAQGVRHHGWGGTADRIQRAAELALQRAPDSTASGLAAAPLSRVAAAQPMPALATVTDAIAPLQPSSAVIVSAAVGSAAVGSATEDLGNDTRPLMDDRAGDAREQTATEAPSVEATAPHRSIAGEGAPDGGGANAPKRLLALSKHTFVRAAPAHTAEKLGYLRTGASVRRHEQPTSKQGCPGGWFAIAPFGYVCAGETAALNDAHVVAALVPRRADRGNGLPYLYGLPRHGAMPLYARLPAKDEQAALEPELGGRASWSLPEDWRDVPITPMPSTLADGAPLPTPFGFPRPSGTVTLGRAPARSGFAVLSVFESRGRRFGLTPDLSLVPLDRLEPVTASAFRGVELGAGEGQNDGTGVTRVAFARRGAPTYSGAEAGALAVNGKLGHRQAVLLDARAMSRGGESYLGLLSGGWVRRADVVLIEPSTSVPREAKGGRWIDVSIDSQSLVAFEGSRPVFATLVSTGSDGAGEPETTRSTVLGTFRIHAKHVTATMGSEQVGDEYAMGDVPYVQYFRDGYALHAAYWHDAFGRPKSHGCINLSPQDARWLFHWTAPPVPHGWHGVMTREGTVVRVRR